MQLSMHRSKGVLHLLRAKQTRDERERLTERLEMIGLQDKRHVRAGALSTGRSSGWKSA